MAFTPTKFLNASTSIFLKDQKHASKLFANDSFRLAPKFDHLFHVAFNINPAVLKSVDLVQRHRNEINMLVKKISLPKFTVTADTVNQYNRKKVIQTQHKFEDTTVTFHDDNMGLINMLWQNYYSYYYADSTSATQAGAYNRTATKNADYISNAYGLDNGSSIPFFNYITIYQMARHEYVAYKLHNPLIKSFDHKEVSYGGATNTHENTMVFSFEAVSYTSGEVTSDNVEGFGLEHYDVNPSPLIGVANPVSLSPSFVSQQNVTANLSENLNNIVTGINSYQNTAERNPTGVSGLLTLDPTQTVSGLQGFTFPQSANVPNAGTTTATKINIIRD